MGLLDGDIKQAVGSALSSILLPFEVRRWSGEGYNETTGVKTDGTPTDYSCKGVVLEYSDRMISEGIVTEKNRKILITSASLSITPTQEDKVIDNDGKLWPILGIKKDPASATWIIKSEV